MTQSSFKQLLDSIRQLKVELSPEEKLQLANELHEIQKLDYTDGELFLHADSTVERDLRSISCRKEPMTVAWLKRELKPGDVLYDIGANVGAYSLIASHASQRKATIYAFEPSFQNFRQLCRNIILNNCESSIIPFQIPLCKKHCLDRFHYQNLESGGALHSFSRNIDYKSEAFEPVVSLGMLGLSLNDLVEIPGVLLPDLLKVDVDGLEYDILLGASNVLQNSQLRSILIELNEDLPEETQNIIDLLYAQGLVPLEKHKLHRNLHNYIFERDSSRAEESVHASGVKLASSREKGW
ncbi:FkbM family methyltransferase [Cyanobium sp. ATX 6F1]|uniref:FkbM family methyltransferase n=1 Tax=unclassified Cyanobium TaxID=2627006 RepID=UPI0020CD0941|nr:FkbM family methyltransferase [Cyanobium sp. ATX 6F1]MCP9916787.1 FkbM family methyltransferase [Cyanobium sp. ATX 6F1]